MTLKAKVHAVLSSAEYIDGQRRIVLKFRDAASFDNTLTIVDTLGLQVDDEMEFTLL